MRRSHSRLCVLLACAGLFWFARPALAQDDAVSSTECCIDMLFPVGARSVSLGDAVTARPGQDAIFANPAALSAFGKAQLSAHRSTLADASRTTLGGLFVMKDIGVFGLSYHLIDFGEQEATDEGGATGTFGVIYQQLIASFATRVGVGWSAGINYRLYDYRPSCTGFVCTGQDEAGTTHMVDAGVTFEPTFLRSLSLGASMMHAGFPLQIRNAAQADPTPARLRLGVAYEAGHHFTRDSVLAVWLHADAVTRLRDPGSPAINFGIEAELDETIFFRAGHASAGDGITAGGTGIGLGLKYERFEVSVAKTVSTSPLFEGEPIHVSFAVTF